MDEATDRAPDDWLKWAWDRARIGQSEGLGVEEAETALAEARRAGPAGTSVRTSADGTVQRPASDSRVEAIALPGSLESASHAKRASPRFSRDRRGRELGGYPGALEQSRLVTGTSTGGAPGCAGH